MPSDPSRRTGASDTAPEIEAMLIAAFRRMTPAEKIARVVALNRAVAQMASARMRAQYGPDLTDEELDHRLAALRLGRDTMIEVFGWDPRARGW